MKNINVLLLVILSCTIQMFGQSVGIGTTTPNASAILDIQSTSQGVLFPTMTTAQRESILNPPHGLHIFNIEQGCLNYYDSTMQIWNCYCDACKTAVVQIHEDTCSIDFYNDYAKFYPAANYIIEVDSGVTISACDTNASAMHFLNMPSNHFIKIVNHGTIAGGGGKGGAGAINSGCVFSFFYAESGKPGGNAILTKTGVAILVENHGIVAGGGGGGGGGSANPTGYGGGGGGGAGIEAASGGLGGGVYANVPPFGICVPLQNLGDPGSPGTITMGGAGGAGISGGGAGGNGGDRGQAGQNGVGTVFGGGGPAGKVISGGSGNILVNIGSGESFGAVD